MTRKRSMAMVLALGATLISAGTALAGNWASATVTDTPDGAVAGTEAVIGVELKQHGVEPISWETLSFTASDAASGDRISAQGTPEGPVGHYAIRVTFPHEGQWSWQLHTGTLALDEMTYPSISVAPAIGTPLSTPTGVDPVLVLGLVMLLGLFGALGWTALRGRARVGRGTGVEVPATAR